MIQTVSSGEPDQVIGVIAVLPARKAASFRDEIFAEFLKHAGANVKQRLLTAWNAIIANDELPIALTRSKIVAV